MAEGADFPKKETDAPSGLWFWLLIGFLLLPWIYIQSNTSVNSDVAWLSICAERIIDGGTFFSDCYDTNPPLSTFLYIPFIWLSQITGIAAYHILFWGTLTTIGLGTFLTYRILAFMPSLSVNERLIICVTYLFTLTIIPTIYFAERDHFLAMMILPFIVLQFCISDRKKTPALLSYTILLFGSMTLLLKPHYGLIPLIIFVHRMISQRRIFIVFDKDFLTLTLLTAFYISSVILFYPDFISFMLPDILSTYAGYNNIAGTYRSSLPYGALIIFTGLLTLRARGNFGKFVKLWWVCAVLGLCCYVIQMKGFTYHRLPLYSLIFPLLSALIAHAVIHVAKKPDNKGIAVLALFMIAALSYTASPLRPDYATHSAYINNEITQYIDEQCTEPCAFYITHNNMDIVSQIGFYSPHTYATRFPSFWFMTANAHLSDQEILNKTTQYGQYIAEDLDRYTPSLLLILAKTEDQGEFTNDMDVAQIFAVSDEFKSALSNYDKIDRLTVDRAYFYKDTPYDFPYELTWDVYKRR